MVFSERLIRFFTVADIDRQGLWHLRFWMRLREVQPSFVVMTLRLFFLFLLSLFDVSFRLWKRECFDRPVEVIFDKRPEELTRQTDEELPHSYLLIAASARTCCPARHCQEDVPDSYK